MFLYFKNIPQRQAIHVPLWNKAFWRSLFHTFNFTGWIMYSFCKLNWCHNQMSSISSVVSKNSWTIHWNWKNENKDLQNTNTLYLNNNEDISCLWAKFKTLKPYTLSTHSVTTYILFSLSWDCSLSIIILFHYMTFWISIGSSREQAFMPITEYQLLHTKILMAFQMYYAKLYQYNYIS